MENLITFAELVRMTDTKYNIKYLQQFGIFQPSYAGMYDYGWIRVFREARRYMRAGLDQVAAYSEAMNDVFGKYPEGYEPQ